MRHIDIQEIGKSFDTVQALAQISFQVDQGELFGLIGPDGAGKTTLFRILSTLLIPDRGDAKIGGLDTVRDYRSLRKRIGYMPGKFSLYQDLTVEENLNFFATIFGTKLEENYDLVKDIYVQIEPFKKRRAGKLSGGMKQKLALSCALIHRPEVLLLDEPTTGVDAVSRVEFWEMLSKIQREGITILVSTPYMDEASRCDRIALIQEGQIYDIDTPEAIIGSFPKTVYQLSGDYPYQLVHKLRRESMTDRVELFGDSLHVTLNNGFDKEDLVERAKSLNGSEIRIEIIQPTIEDVFLDLMQTMVP